MQCAAAVDAAVSISVVVVVVVGAAVVAAVLLLLLLVLVDASVWSVVWCSLHVVLGTALPEQLLLHCLCRVLLLLLLTICDVVFLRRCFGNRVLWGQGLLFLCI